jgi:hypothetical protein
MIFATNRKAKLVKNARGENFAPKGRTANVDREKPDDRIQQNSEKGNE